MEDLLKRRDICVDEIARLENGDDTGIANEGFLVGSDRIQKLLRLRRATLAHINGEIEERRRALRRK